MASTVVSVGPYELNITRPRDHRAITSGGHSSPAVTTTTPGSTSPSSNNANTPGGNVTCVTPSRAKNTANSPPNRSSCGTTTNAAPVNNAIDHSHPNVSKPADANCATRHPGPTPNNPR